MKHAERRRRGTNKNRTTARSSSRQRRQRCRLFPGDASSSWIPISLYCWMVSTALRVLPRNVLLWGGEAYVVVGLQPPRRRFASGRAWETVFWSTNGRAINADDTTENAKTTTAAASAASSSSSASSPPLILPSHPNFPIRSVMAPMVAVSDYPFRVLVREYGQVDLTYTQMILAKRFNVDKSFRRTHLDLYETAMTTTSNTRNSNNNHNHNDENDQTYLDHFHPAQLNCIGRTERDRTAYHERRTHLHATGTPLVREAASTAPLMVQLAGDTVEDVVHTALQIYEHTEGHVHGFDLNCGCPQHIAKKGNYGAFLMDRDPARVRDILHGLRQQLPASVAVSAKIRLPVDDPTLIERIPVLMATGKGITTYKKNSRTSQVVVVCVNLGDGLIFILLNIVVVDLPYQ